MLVFEGGMIISKKEILNLLHDLNIKLDEKQLSTLFNRIEKTNYDFEFSDDEIDQINLIIKENDFNMFFEFLDFKLKVAKEIDKDVLLEKVDNNLWRFIIDQCCDKCKEQFPRNEFLSALSPYEKLAMQFSDFDYVIKNGDLSQWYEYELYEDLDVLKDFLKYSYFDKKEEFLLILDNFEMVKDSIDALDIGDPFYEDDYQTRINALQYSCKDYMAIEKGWNNYFQNYLYENIPDYYLNLINNQKDMDSVSI